MKFKVAFKTPDALYEANKEISERFQDDPENPQRDEELDSLIRCTSEFLQYGEQITVEFDTETGTATVLPVPHRRSSY